MSSMCPCPGRSASLEFDLLGLVKRIYHAIQFKPPISIPFFLDELAPTFAVWNFFLQLTKLLNRFVDFPAGYCLIDATLNPLFQFRCVYIFPRPSNIIASLQPKLPKRENYQQRQPRFPKNAHQQKNHSSSSNHVGVLSRHRHGDVFDFFVWYVHVFTFFARFSSTLAITFSRLR